MNWEKARILIGVVGKPMKREGWRCGGLGLFRLMLPLPPFAGMWGVYHLNTGHSICFLRGEEAEVFDIATQMVRLGDWEFDGLAGWRNAFPDMPEQMLLMQSRYPQKITFHSGSQNEALAMTVLMARENARAAGTKRAKKSKKK